MQESAFNRVFTAKRKRLPFAEWFKKERGSTNASTQTIIDPGYRLYRTFLINLMESVFLLTAVDDELSSLEKSVGKGKAVLPVKIAPRNPEKQLPTNIVEVEEGCYKSVPFPALDNEFQFTLNDSASEDHIKRHNFLLAERREDGRCFSSRRFHRVEKSIPMQKLDWPLLVQLATLVLLHKEKSRFMNEHARYGVFSYVANLLGVFDHEKHNFWKYSNNMGVLRTHPRMIQWFNNDISPLLDSWGISSVCKDYGFGPSDTGQTDFFSPDKDGGDEKPDDEKALKKYSKA